VNGLTSPKAGASDWPPGGIPRAARKAPEARDPFAGILDTHQARTATAEGQDRSPSTRGYDNREDRAAASDRADRSNARLARERNDGAERERSVQHHEDDARPVADKPADAVATQVADAQASVPQGDASKAGDGEQKKPAGATGQPVADQPAADSVIVPTALLAAISTQAQPKASPDAAAIAGAGAKPAPAMQPAAPRPAAPQPAAPQGAVAEAAAQTVADAQAQPAQGDAAKAVAPSDQAVTPAASKDVPAGADRPAAPAAPVSAEPKDASNGANQQQGQQSQGQPAPQQQAPADAVRTVAQAGGSVDKTQQAQTEVPNTQPGGTPAGSPVTQVTGGQPAAVRGGVPQATAVPLSRAAENVEHVLRLASIRGVTHARIELHPASLGSVDVHLRQTADGLVASVTGHSQEAVQQLQQAAGELRRHLEDQGVNLLSLDIGQSADDERSAGRAGAGFGENGQAGDGARSGAADDANGSDAEVTTNSTLRLPNGVLVDVLA
jgi:flagellar hook-length control protein FliK